MPNPNDIERFVLATDGGAVELGGAVPYIRQCLNSTELRVSRDLYDQYFQAFIMTNNEDLVLWEKLHGPVAPQTGTKGFFSSIGNFFTGDDDVEEKKTPAPPAPAPPIKDGLVTAPAGTVNAPAKSRGLTSNEITRRTQRRIDMQQQGRVMTPTPPMRMMMMPPPPRGNMVRVEPQWNSELQGMAIVKHELLPKELIVDDVTLAQLHQTESFRFPPGPQCPVTNGMAIPGNLVKFVPVDRDPHSVCRYMDQQGEDYYRQNVNPPWVTQNIPFQSFSSGKVKEPIRKPHGEHRSINKSMKGLALKETSTAAKAGAHTARAERHHRAKVELDELLNAHKTAY